MRLIMFISRRRVWAWKAAFRFLSASRSNSSCRLYLIKTEISWTAQTWWVEITAWNGVAFMIYRPPLIFIEVCCKLFLSLARGLFPAIRWEKDKLDSEMNVHRRDKNFSYESSQSVFDQQKLKKLEVESFKLAVRFTCPNPFNKSQAFLQCFTFSWWK